MTKHVLLPHLNCQGEYASVAAQRDSEAADIEKEKQLQATPETRKHEMEELAQVCVPFIHARLISYRALSHTCDIVASDLRQPRALH